MAREFLMRKAKLIFIILLFFFFAQIISAQIPSPKDFLGFEVGEAKKLADMNQIIDYFKQLDAASDRILVEEVGKTTESNPFIVAYITSVENHQNLEQYRQYQQLLADPRKINDEEAEKIIAESKAIVMINCSIHATEIGTSQMSMKLAYDLATKNDPKTREILDSVILLIIPMHNPDGIQLVVDWYRKYLGTKYEGSGMPWLYNTYTGHENNRDWYMFTQVESQLTIKVHNAWHPQIVVDMHQMGSCGARLFVPPYIDPYEPNIDPIIQQQVAMMGTFIATELTAEGKAGVMHSQGFDAWTPGRAYHHYHGGIRILTEVASVRIATPISIKFEDLPNSVKSPSVSMPLPWKGGDWTLKDIVAYDYSAAKAALTNAARLRENWLINFYQIHKKAVNRTDPPFAFVFPAVQRDIPATIKMLQTLQMGLVEIHQAKMDFKAGEQNYPAGTFIIFLAQPYGSYAKALLEKQVYPEIRETPDGPLKMPYDVVAHTLPLLMGVKVVTIDQPFQVDAEKLDKIQKPAGSIADAGNAFGYAWGHETNDDIIALNRLLKKDHQVYWTAEAFESQGKIYPAGTMIVKNTNGLATELRAVVKDLHVQFEGLQSNPKIKIYKLKLPRLALYKSWIALIDEGWTRWVLEQFEFSYQSVFDNDIRNGTLDQNFDVILFPDVAELAIMQGNSDRVMPPEYCGGIGEEGVKNIKAFVEQGGTIITLNSSANFAIKQFNLDVTNSVDKIVRKDFFIPGSILKVQNKTVHPIAYGFQDEAAIFFRRSPVFEVKLGTSVVTYPESNPLLSGWINGEKYLFNKSAIVDVPYGKGKIILIGFPAQYRGQSHGTFRYLFNAIYYGKAEVGN
jgi:hypothetical protein